MRAALNACQGITRGGIALQGSSFVVDPRLAPSQPLHSLLLRICEFGLLFRWVWLQMQPAQSLCKSTLTAGQPLATLSSLLSRRLLQMGDSCSYGQSNLSWLGSAQLSSVTRTMR